MNHRRKLLKVFVASVLASPLAAFAQQPAKIPRIGFLISETLAGQASRIEALRAGLRDLGYIENKNLIIELRPADGPKRRFFQTEIFRPPHQLTHQSGFAHARRPDQQDAPSAPRRQGFGQAL